MALVNRWYDILETLLIQNQLAFDDLRKHMKISPQTLTKSIEQLNDLLDGDIEIIQTNNQLELTVYDYARLETILAGSLRKTSDFNSASKRVAYLLKRLLESPTPIVIDDLAEETGVSRSTINKDLKTAKELASLYHIEIKGIPNRGIQAFGSELKIRLLFIHHVYAYFDTDYLQKESLVFLENLYKVYRLPRKIQELLNKTIAITIKRIHENNHLTDYIPFYSNEVKSNSFMEELVYHLELDYQTSLSQFERDFISFALNTQYIDGLTYHEGLLNPDFLQLYQKMIQEVKESLLINFDEEKLFVEIHTHLKFLINRLIFQIQANDLFHGEIKHKYPLAFEMATSAGKVLEETFSTHLEISECSYLALYFELILRDKEQIVEKGSKRIAVVCTTGRGTANMICRRITKVLGPDIEIFQFSEEQFNPERDDNYFAIFTTIPLKFGQLKSPLVQITNVFNDQWLQNEWQKVHLFHQRNIQDSIIRFVRLKPESTYCSYLTNMVKILAKKNIVDLGFSERIIQREMKQSTMFGNQVAFPHAINYHSDKPILLVGVLDQIFCEGYNQVAIIFMVAIPKKVETRLEAEMLELYDDIFRIASDELLRSELRLIESEEAFYQFTEERGIF
ncbi:BglG family transcription antiterminator [Streptococcus dysgalactiae]|uniref:BglG family transcription antiterminator n=1 Tax=Streptococcus dysgalactiae TaxID=1334 RepID=UPI0024B7F293|nr:PRD domain-containing protein [Streptococcus dysgalactiae]